MIHSIAIQELQDVQWQTYFELFNQLTTRYFPRDWVADWEAFKKRRLATLTVLDSEEFAFVQDGQVVGWLRNALEAGKHIFYWDVAPEHVSKAALHLTGKLVLDFMQALNLQKALFISNSPRADQLKQVLEGTIVETRYYYVFRPEQALVKRILADLPKMEARNPGYHFTLYQDRPDEILEEYVVLHNTVIKDIPQTDPNAPPHTGWPAEDLRKLRESNRGNGNTTYTGVIWDDQHQMAALTDTNINTNHPNRIYQGMTGVHPQHRGKGLAKWLKAAMIKRLLQDFPTFEVIDTDCHELNEPIRQLNAAMGYQLDGKGFEYQFTQKKLKERLPHVYS